jgi:hypothetical protein
MSASPKNPPNAWIFEGGAMPRPHFAVFSLLLSLGLSLLPSAARAADGWGEPTRTCSDAVFVSLDDEVALRCAHRDRSCLDVEGCFNLRRTRDILHDCQRAVDNLNLVCYAGSFVYLRVESFALQHQIDICSERIAMPQPFGCGKPCPI